MSAAGDVVGEFAMEMGEGRRVSCWSFDDDPSCFALWTSLERIFVDSLTSILVGRLPHFIKLKENFPFPDDERVAMTRSLARLHCLPSSVDLALLGRITSPILALFSSFSTILTTPSIHSTPTLMSSIRMSNGQGLNGGTGGGGGGGGGRKMNAANHLLNFSLPTRAERAVVPRRSRKGGGGEGARWQIFNKESEFQIDPSFSFPHSLPSLESVSNSSELIFARSRLLSSPEFVNASFRFMLKATGDFTVYFTDSDM